jgi:hypothetical protein
VLDIGFPALQLNCKFQLDARSAHAQFHVRRRKAGMDEGENHAYAKRTETESDLFIHGPGGKDRVGGGRLHRVAGSSFDFKERQEWDMEEDRVAAARAL